MTLILLAPNRNFWDPYLGPAVGFFGTPIWGQQSEFLGPLFGDLEVVRDPFWAQLNLEGFPEGFPWVTFFVLNPQKKSVNSTTLSRSLGSK